MVDAIADLMGEKDGEDEASGRARAAFGLAIPSVKGLLGPSISRMVPRQRERVREFRSAPALGHLK